MKKRNINWRPWIITGSVFLLLISSLSFFITANIYDSEKFAEKTTAAITSEPVREAIASKVSSTVLAEQSPIAQRLLSEPIEALVAGLLKTDNFSKIFYEFSKGLNQFVTTRDFEPITIDIGSIVPTLESVVDKLAPDNELDLAQYEDTEIVLLENSDLPPFATIGKVLVILGPISLLALIGVGIVTFRKLKDKKDMLKYSGMVLVITGVLLLVLTYSSAALLTVTILDPERSTIMAAIYESFISSFRTLQYLTVVFGGALWLGHYFWKNNVNISSHLKK